MVTHLWFTGLPSTVKRKPLQAGKFAGILVAIVLGVGGFFRIFGGRGIVDDPLLGDGQFLALVLIPLLSFGLVLVVLVETVVTGYRSLRADESVTEQLTDRISYTVLRSVEAVFAVVGAAIMLTVLPVLVADSTPAPAGVGIMLVAMAVGFGILFASLVRSFAELFVYEGGPGQR